MKEGLTVLEVIGLAIRSEEEAADFYGHMAGRIKNELVRTKYESLAKEEIDHRHMLVELYKKMTGENSAPPKIPGKPKAAEGKKEGVASESFEKLLKIAIKREQEANDFYRKAAAHAIDTNAKRTFEYLADIEQGHELLLKREYDSYLRDRNWYAEKPDVQLVGP